MGGIFEFKVDDFVTRIRENKLKKDRVVEKALMNKEAEWREHEDGIITWKNRIYVPKIPKLREDIIREFHNSITAGHPGQYKMQELIARSYWWPYISSDVK